jgi:hypothetical protein
MDVLIVDWLYLVVDRTIATLIGTTAGELTNVRVSLNYVCEHC